MHTNRCVLTEISMEKGMLNFWLGLLVTAQMKETYFSEVLEFWVAPYPNLKLHIQPMKKEGFKSHPITILFCEKYRETPLLLICHTYETTSWEIFFSSKISMYLMIRKQTCDQALQTIGFSFRDHPYFT